MATIDIDNIPYTAGSEDDELEGAEMSLVDHLQELRRRLFACILAVVVTSIFAFIFWEPIFTLLTSPLPAASNVLIVHGHPKLVVTGIGEGFSTILMISIAVGIALAAPIWLYQLWGFISPALTRHERKHAAPFTVIGTSLFVAGLAVGFVVLRFPINWLIDFGQSHFVELITAANYFSFIAFFLLAFGIAFELPLVLTFLALVGVVSSQWLAQKRAYILVGLWILSCFITPGADPYSPVILGVSFTILFFLSELLIRAIGK
jgi:sec-independent protein translocase protein TatC